MSLLSSVQLCDAAGISFRQLDYWTRLGVLQPTIEAHGSGSGRRYDEREVAVARVLLRLTQGLHAKPRQISDLGDVAARIRAEGPIGTVELVPGITADLEVLARDPEPKSIGSYR